MQEISFSRCEHHLFQGIQNALTVRYVPIQAANEQSSNNTIVHDKRLCWHLLYCIFIIQGSWPFNMHTKNRMLHIRSSKISKWWILSPYTIKLMSHLMLETTWRRTCITRQTSLWGQFTKQRFNNFLTSCAKPPSHPGVRVPMCSLHLKTRLLFRCIMYILPMWFLQPGRNSRKCECQFLCLRPP